jgi:hypothetical protein
VTVTLNVLLLLVGNNKKIAARLRIERWPPCWAVLPVLDHGGTVCLLAAQTDSPQTPLGRWLTWPPKPSGSRNLPGSRHSDRDCN